MVKTYSTDGKEIFINPDSIIFIEFMCGGGYNKDYTQVTVSDGKTYRLSSTAYEALTGATLNKKGPGKPRFEVL